MRISYRLRVFLLLSLVFAVALTGWSLWRWASHAEEREAWDETVHRLRVQKTRIDSLEAAITGVDREVDREREALENARQRITHYERRAVSGRLPTPDYRRYMEAIETHNEVVETHNEALARVHAVYGEYADLVDRHNALIDSANAMQRRAVEEGFQLPAADLELR